MTAPKLTAQQIDDWLQRAWEQEMASGGNVAPGVFLRRALRRALALSEIMPDGAPTDG